MTNHWIDPNFNVKIPRQIWLKEINNWVSKNSKECITNKCAATKWFKSSQTWTDLYFSNEYLYILFSDYFLASRHTYGPVGVNEKGHTIVDVGGSIFGAYNLLKYGVRGVLITNFDNSPQMKFTSHIAKKYKLKIKVIPNNKILNNSIMLCSEYFEHFKNVDKEIGRLLKFKPKRIWVKNSFCVNAFGHYRPIEIGGHKYTDYKLANKAFQKLLISKGYKLTKVPRWFGGLEKYTRLK